MVSTQDEILLVQWEETKVWKSSVFDRPCVSANPLPLLHYDNLLSVHGVLYSGNLVSCKEPLTLHSVWGHKS